MTTSHDFLSVSDICALTGLADNTIRLHRIKGKFPQPYMIHVRSPVWRRADIEDFIAGRATVADVHARYEADRQEAAA